MCKKGPGTPPEPFLTPRLPRKATSRVSKFVLAILADLFWIPRWTIFRKNLILQRPYNKETPN